LGCEPNATESTEQKQSNAQAPPDSQLPHILLVDDFSQDGGLSSLGTPWRSITDQVMGGVSTGSHSFEVIDGKRCIRLRGRISLDNNGGFVMIALNLDPNQRLLDASDYKGLRLQIRGNDQDYLVHLKTNQTPGHSQYYTARFNAPDRWQTIEIPFNSFTGKNVSERINTSQLRRIGILGAWREFNADVAVARVELYR
jgi:hypothetical protein